MARYQMDLKSKTCILSTCTIIGGDIHNNKDSLLSETLTDLCLAMIEAWEAKKDKDAEVLAKAVYLVLGDALGMPSVELMKGKES